jgi:hypothetical protein
MKNASGLLLVGAAAAVLLLVVKRSTPAGTPGAGGSAQGAIGANAASFWSNVINNVGGRPTSTSAAGLGSAGMGGLTMFGNGTFDVGGIYVDPGQVTYNTQTGAVQESPFSGMYNILSSATYGF